MSAVRGAGAVCKIFSVYDTRSQVNSRKFNFKAEFAEGYDRHIFNNTSPEVIF